jgi:hypothetical protein
VLSARGRPRLSRPWLLGLLLVWLLTSASSCQMSVNNGSGTVAASGAAAGVGIGLFLVGGAFLCVVHTEECFPDEEALRARYETHVGAQARFTRGLRLYQAQDPEGLALICRSAHDGYAIAQYFYGSRLLKREPPRRAEAIGWLQRAGAQGHRTADLVLRREAGRAGLSMHGSAPSPQALADPPCTPVQGTNLSRQELASAPCRHPRCRDVRSSPPNAS